MAKNKQQPEQDQDEQIQNNQKIGDLSDKEIADDCFSYDQRQFRVILPVMNIPGIGVRTKLEVLTDEDAQRYLVENDCIGSAIAEVE